MKPARRSTSRHGGEGAALSVNQRRGAPVAVGIIKMDAPARMSYFHI